MQAIYVISPNFWMPSPIPSTSIPAKEEWGGNVCVLTYDALDVDAITRSVGDDRAGATVTFIGTTRNSFRGTVSNHNVPSIVDILYRKGCDATGIPGLQ